MSFYCRSRPLVFAGLAWIFLALSLRAATPELTQPQTVEQWGLFEVSLKGPSDGNPFTEVRFTATFTNGEKAIEVPGFYDGAGVYRVRFMPDRLGPWRYDTAPENADRAAPRCSWR